MLPAGGVPLKVLVTAPALVTVANVAHAGTPSAHRVTSSASGAVEAETTKLNRFVIVPAWFVLAGAVNVGGWSGAAVVNTLVVPE